MGFSVTLFSLSLVFNIRLVYFTENKTKNMKHLCVGIDSGVVVSLLAVRGRPPRSNLVWKVSFQSNFTDIVFQSSVFSSVFQSSVSQSILESFFEFFSQKDAARLCVRCEGHP